MNKSKEYTVINKTDPDLLFAINEIKNSIKELKPEPITSEWTEAELDAVSFPCDTNTHVIGFILGFTFGIISGFIFMYYFMKG